MNPIVSEFIKFLAREVASEVVKHIAGDKPEQPKQKRTRKPAETPAQVEVAVERSETEWRADCMKIIGELAPTHGPELRALFADRQSARLSDLAADVLPAFLMDLVALKGKADAN